MNHYPHHLGDYAKDTAGFTALEHGVYRLLLDAYYASEEPPLAEEVHTIAKAATPTERKAVAKVLRKFELRAGRYFHKRVEQELAAYRQRSKEASDKANTRWEKERARKAHAAMPVHMPEHEPMHSPGNAAAMLASNQKPESSTTAFPVMETSPPEPPTAGEESNPEPQPDPERIAGLTALLRLAKVSDLPTCRPLMERWLRSATDVQLQRAVNEACRSKGGYPFAAAYLDPIVLRVVKFDRDAREAAEGKVSATQAQIAEQRAWTPSPMPASAAKFVPRKRPP